MPLLPDQARRLAEHLKVDGHDASPGSRDPLTTAQPLPPQVGSYRIVRVIASGGMGTVYEARQERPDRVVALKVMKHGIASPEALKRFLIESEILGRLCHPAIAQVYDAGVHDDGFGGVPFFAMEFIPGARPMTTFADAEGLTARHRLELFATVCDGVHHAHQKGVIHRDLKPGNILVDEAGVPKIIDFGVARATDSDVTLTTLRTDARELLGTIQYMSPEQCAGDPNAIDVRSDVYSLGVNLYELLCGRLPYDLSKTAIPHATRIIQDQDPPRPSTISRKLRGGLEAIVLKALQKRPEKRYQSSAALADDVRNHLAGRPTMARTPTALAQVAHWITRHPVAATFATCVLVASLTLAATIVSVWFINAQPHEIEVSQNRREARLRSISGRILHTWDARADAGVRDATLVRRPRGGLLALVGYGEGADSTHGSLCAYDLAADLGTPLWTARIEPADVGPDIRVQGYTEAGYAVDWILVADAFDDPEGPEVITCFAHVPRSARAIRIHDLEGNLLYQVWHDGSASDPQWLGPSRLVVLVGDNKAARWVDRRIDAPYFPRVVFALRPELGFITTTWLPYTGPYPSATVAWYKALMPAEHTRTLSNVRLGAATGNDRRNHGVRVHMQVGEDPSAVVNYFVDDGGVLHAASAIKADHTVEWPVDTASLWLGDLRPKK